MLLVVSTCTWLGLLVVREWLVKSEMDVADRSGVEAQGWKESESESEKQEDDELLASLSAANVQFTLGSDP